jgi:TP901 family phage tail tape measure protein
MGGIASSLQRVAEFAAGNLLTGGVSALTGAFHDAVSAGADFGSVVNKIQAVGDVTAKYGDQAGSVMDRVRAKALQLGADLPISAKTAADGILELVASGMEVEQAMEASTGVSQLAAAHMLEVGRSAEIVGVALNGFKMRADEAGRAADGVFFTGRPRGRLGTASTAA